jgi:hypothetical protein
VLAIASQLVVRMLRAASLKIGTIILQVQAAVMRFVRFVCENKKLRRQPKQTTQQPTINVTTHSTSSQSGIQPASLF